MLLCFLFLSSETEGLWCCLETISWTFFLMLYPPSELLHFDACVWMCSELRGCKEVFFCSGVILSGFAPLPYWSVCLKEAKIFCKVLYKCSVNTYLSSVLRICFCVLYFFRRVESLCHWSYSVVISCNTHPILARHYFPGIVLVKLLKNMFWVSSCAATLS